MFDTERGQVGALVTTLGRDLLNTCMQNACQKQIWMDGHGGVNSSSVHFVGLYQCLKGLIQNDGEISKQKKKQGMQNESRIHSHMDT